MSVRQGEGGDGADGRRLGDDAAHRLRLAMLLHGNMVRPAEAPDTPPQWPRSYLDDMLRLPRRAATWGQFIGQIRPMKEVDRMGEAIEPAAPEPRAYPELTKEALEAAIRSGKREVDLAVMFGVSISQIKHRKIQWGLKGISPLGRGRCGKHVQSARGAATEERPEDIGASDKSDHFAITLVRGSIAREEAASLLSGLAGYLRGGNGNVSVRVEVEEAAR